jgi:hypothetical protein
MTRNEHLAALVALKRDLDEAERATYRGQGGTESGRFRWRDVAGVLGFGSPQAAQQWHARNGGRVSVTANEMSDVYNLFPYCEGGGLKASDHLQGGHGGELGQVVDVVSVGPGPEVRQEGVEDHQGFFTVEGVMARGEHGD